MNTEATYWGNGEGAVRRSPVTEEETTLRVSSFCLTTSITNLKRMALFSLLYLLLV